jgi:hypothetical protein
MGEIVAATLVIETFNIKREMNILDRIIQDAELKKKALTLQLNELIIEIKHETR